MKAIDELPETLYSAAQVRQLDAVAINQFNIDGFDLMGRAARAAFESLLQQWPELEAGSSLQVFCGGGNNGGDGYLIARLAAEHSILVSVVYLKDPAQLKGDARKAFLACSELQVPIRPYSSDLEIKGDVLVDAMLGTGLGRDVEGDFREVIFRLNTSGKPVMAVDIPSGLCADTGVAKGLAVNSELTVTFIGMKKGLLTGRGPELCGRLVYAGLDVPDSVFAQVPSSGVRLSESLLAPLIQPRVKDSYKGLNGHVLLVGGNHGMPGSILMAAEAAICSGAGKVTVATRPEHEQMITLRRPELMTVSLEDKPDLLPLLADKDVVVIGPGLGKDAWALSLVKSVLQAECPVVMDADALNLLSEHPQLRGTQKSPIILTPHTGEAAKLLNGSSAEIQKDRFAAAEQLCSFYKAVTVLKGAGTLIYDNKEMALCSDGNPGMAVAGMGDVLSGVTGALLGQGLSTTEAARLGVWLHANGADDLAEQQGELGLLATEIIPSIRRRLNQLAATD